jgi:AAA+ ATPase superfamily predicted ATPase
LEEGVVVHKPDRIFDRDREWQALAPFGEARTPQLAIVSGRRRQGKTFLLSGLVRQTEGFYFGATEATEADSLRRFGEAAARFSRDPVTPNFRDWSEAMTYLFQVGASTRKPMVIDEFPYLSQVSPELPSIVQREIDQATYDDRPVSILLCGSAISLMGRLLAGDAPLRGRATLELVVKPFDYRLAAEYWAIHDPQLAVMLHSIVGGTPAYLRFAGGDSPADSSDFDAWVKRTVLNPERPLFREARYVLEEGTDMRDTAIYHSVLAAISVGNRTRGSIAAYVGRKASDIGHQLNVLEDCGLIRRDADLFHANRSVYAVAEPLVAFYQAVMRPDWGLLESGFAGTVWKNCRQVYLSQVLGPHFEQLCRDFTLMNPQLLGGETGRVGQGEVFDRQAREGMQVDVAVLASRETSGQSRVLALGEAKWGKVLGQRHLKRLQRAREVLGRQGYDTQDTKLVLFSGKGFDDTVSSAGSHVLTIGLQDLYGNMKEP